jgi:WD40 repeat protein
LKLTNRVTIDKITFNPFDDSKVIINASDGLYIMDTSNLSISKVAPKTVADFTTSYDRLLWVNNSGISSYNLVLNSSTTIDSFATRTAILPDKINISSSGSLISVLDKSGRLYLFGSATQIPIVVADQVQASSFSPDSLYLAFGKSDGSVYVYDIDDDTYFNLGIGNGATINDIEWYKDSAHLFELQNNDLNFIEVATGTPVNSDLISNNVSQFNYSSNEDAVYYLANGEIFSFAITR